ncbi:MAG: phosphodiester glycosidase family protein [Lachnospiraceae bacterium]|jgi:exopolysaccharide biosynthesis protein
MKVIKAIGKVLVTLLVTIIALLAACILAIFLLEKGPSETAKIIFVHSVKETSRMGFLSTMFLSEEEVDKIMATGGMEDIEAGITSDTELIVIDNKEVTQDFEIVDVTGGSFKGKMMIIRDPSRVFVGIIPEFGHFNGMTVMDIIDTYNASGDDIIGGINGGDFIDNGANNSFTAQPLGAVITEGEIVYAEYGYDHVYHLAGFTKEDKFIMGNITLNEAIEMGVRDAIYCAHLTGPFLVMNGEPLISEVPDSSTYGSGKNPRTALGQRADGTVILVVVDGRQANSLGATFEDMAYFMAEQGCVNAAAMDGGTSTQMVYEGEILNNPYSPTGPRRCPTSWLVR